MIERARLISTLISIISVLLVIVTLLIYRNYRISHRMKNLEKEIEKRTGELVKQCRPYANDPGIRPIGVPRFA